MSSSSEDPNQSQKKVSPWEAYNFKFNDDITVDIAASKFYAEHFYMWAILEAFLKDGKVNLKDLNEAMANKIPSHINWEVTAKFSQEVILKMTRIGYLKAVDVAGELPEVTLTETGLKAIQNQTFQSLTSTSFFSYQTHLLNKEMIVLSRSSYRISRSSYRTSIAVGIIAFLSLVASLTATLKAFGII